MMLGCLSRSTILGGLSRYLYKLYSLGSSEECPGSVLLLPPGDTQPGNLDRPR